jgi:hypothetical protein
MSLEKVYSLINSEVDKMTGTTEDYYKEKLRNGIQNIYERHKDKFKSKNDVNFLTKMTDEAIEDTYSQIPPVVLKIYLMDNKKTIKIYTEVFDIIEKISNLN